MSSITILNIRDAPAVEDQPHVPALSWRVLATPEGSVHLALLLEGGSIRVTSAFSIADKARKDLITESGRVYRLYGPPEESPELVQAFGLTAVKIAGAPLVDVSDRIWRELEDPVS